MRARIDITEAEADTKIRGKYLRALENEEWRLLPGPTFVRSFLRTYGDYLGLDGRLLVEEFKLRHEQAEGEPRPIAAAGHRAERRRTRGPSNAARTRALIAGARSHRPARRPLRARPWLRRQLRRHEGPEPRPPRPRPASRRCGSSRRRPCTPASAPPTAGRWPTACCSRAVRAVSTAPAVCA